MKLHPFHPSNASGVWLPWSRPLQSLVYCLRPLCPCKVWCIACGPCAHAKFGILLAAPVPLQSLVYCLRPLCPCKVWCIACGPCALAKFGVLLAALVPLQLVSCLRPLCPCKVWCIACGPCAPAKFGILPAAPVPLQSLVYCLRPLCPCKVWCIASDKGLWIVNPALLDGIFQICSSLQPPATLEADLSGGSCNPISPTAFELADAANGESLSLVQLTPSDVQVRISLFECACCDFRSLLCLCPGLWRLLPSPFSSLERDCEWRTAMSKARATLSKIASFLSHQLPIVGTDALARVDKRLRVYIHYLRKHVHCQHFEGPGICAPGSEPVRY